MPKGSRVIMADDDKMLIDMYKERLELAGYIVILCRNGEEALAQVREIKPDIVLLDIMMPKINGYEALASIKSDPATKDIPVIMLSALMRDFNREKAVEAGADDYLIKSEAMPADVITKIEQVLAKYGKGLTPAPGPLVTSSSAAPTTPVANPIPTANLITPPSQASSPAPIIPPTPSSPLISNPVTPTPVNSTPVATPEALVMQPDAINKPVFEPAAPSIPISDIKPPVPESPAPKIEKKEENSEPKPKPDEKKEEDVPVVTLNPKPALGSEPASEPKEDKSKPSVNPALPIMSWEAEPEKKINDKKEKSPANIALIVVAAILITSLVNDVVIYFFFFAKK